MDATKELSLRSDLHIARKLWHISSGLTGLIIFLNSSYETQSWGVGLILLSVASLSFDLLRFRNEKINAIALKLMGPVMRESERNSFSGLPFYSFGIGASLLFFKTDIAVLAILFLIFSDPFSSLIGILFGKIKILPNKSLEGSLAGFFMCSFLTLFTLASKGVLNFELFPFVILAGAFGSVSELLSVFVDDNLTIPLFSGLGLTILNLVWPVF